jgi:CRISPR-associated protein Cmr6
MYFHAVADVGRERWQPVKNTKRLALQAASTVGKAANEILGALTERQARLFTGEGWERATELYAPLLTGSGNPHPVENGFAFLSPYGVPYLAGSGIKGVLRRAAEELALLCEDREGWTLPLVWAIFGFDEKSAYITGDESTEWVQGYQQFIESTAQSPDSLLQQLLEIWFEPRGRPKDQPSFLRELRESKQIRGSIHFQGLVSFLDSFPDAQCRLGVDILNPHHKNYYQGSGGESPHDAEQPVPVFFLVMEPGAKFVLRAQLLPGRTPLLSSVGDWKKLLDAAFDYASQWLGFGAKTSVGYGVLGPDREAEAAARRKALEDEERRKKQAEEEAERRAREEEERRRKEAEEAKRARARAEWDALPEHEKIKRRLQEAAEAYLALNEVERRKVRGDLIAAINEALEQGAQLDSAELREDVATCIEAIYEQVGWADPGSNKNARKRQEKNRRKAIEDLRSGNV